MPRILIIDDDAQVRMMLRMSLEDAGFSVEEASEGGAGIRLYRNNPFDVVVTDIIMPDKEGVQTIMELKQEFPGAKIIALSGGGRFGAESYLKMAKQAGAIRTFTKPIDRENLLGAIQELLN